MSTLQPVAWANSPRPIAVLRFRPSSLVVLLSVIGAVTWLAAVGGFFASYILAAPIASHHAATTYAAFNLNEPAPTGFGSLSVTSADLTPDVGTVRVRVLVQVVNSLDGTVEAPRVEELRVINTNGADVGRPVPGGWLGPAFLTPHSQATIDLSYDVPASAGLLWLEYREPRAPWPTRVPLGSIPVAPVGGAGDVR